MPIKNINHEKQIYREIKANRNLPNEYIANLLGLSISTICVYRWKYNIKSNKKQGRPYKDHKHLKGIICSLLNKEHPQYPVSDYKLCSILNGLGLNVSRLIILRTRHKLKIPPSKSIPKNHLNRKMLYFQEGRYIWKTDGNHRKKK